MSITFNEALCIFIADCMSVVSKEINRAAAIKEMATRANTIFKNFSPTPEKVAEVKAIILQIA